VCSSSTIMVDELVAEGGVEMGILNSVTIFSPHSGYYLGYWVTFSGGESCR